MDFVKFGNKYIKAKDIKLLSLHTGTESVSRTRYYIYLEFKDGAFETLDVTSVDEGRTYIKNFIDGIGNYVDIPHS